MTTLGGFILALCLVGAARIVILSVRSVRALVRVLGSLVRRLAKRRRDGRNHARAPIDYAKLGDAIVDSMERRMRARQARNANPRGMERAS